MLEARYYLYLLLADPGPHISSFFFLHEPAIIFLPLTRYTQAAPFLSFNLLVRRCHHIPSFSILYHLGSLLTLRYQNNKDGAQKT